MTKTIDKTEYGDFQTPYALAVEVCSLIADEGFLPASIVEPTCGKGAFLAAALQFFPDAHALGFDINHDYAACCKQAVSKYPRCKVSVADFFQTDWQAMLSGMPDPILVVGNPPWVTNAALGAIGSSNLPKKSNFQGHRGFDAITGKSNFDISEWMLLHLIDKLSGRNAVLAMLCKTVVARKVLRQSWKRKLPIERADIYCIDAAANFDAAVDACLLCCRLQPGEAQADCNVYGGLSKGAIRKAFGYHDGRLVADLDLYRQWQHLQGNSPYRWRSGVKHDCSKVMELRETPDGLCNGFAERVEIEDACLYPMLKSSELANGKSARPRRWMIVTQQETGQDTSTLKYCAPKTWEYLLANAKHLDNRGSSIYRKRPRFSVFGVGPYSFSPWKIAVSGFYKSLKFVRIGPHHGKPTILDDTAYSLACGTESEAEFLHYLLTSQPASEFYSSLIFWDAKRPITTDVLSALSLECVAEELDCAREFRKFASDNPWILGQSPLQSALFT